MLLFSPNISTLLSECASTLDSEKMEKRRRWKETEEEMGKDALVTNSSNRTDAPFPFTSLISVMRDETGVILKVSLILVAISKICASDTRCIYERSVESINPNPSTLVPAYLLPGNKLP